MARRPARAFGWCPGPACLEACACVRSACLTKGAAQKRSSRKRAYGEGMRRVCVQNADVAGEDAGQKTVLSEMHDVALTWLGHTALGHVVHGWLFCCSGIGCVHVVKWKRDAQGIGCGIDIWLFYNSSATIRGVLPGPTSCAVYTCCCCWADGVAGACACACGCCAGRGCPAGLGAFCFAGGLGRPPC